MITITEKDVGRKVRQADGVSYDSKRFPPLVEFVDDVSTKLTNPKDAAAVGRVPLGLFPQTALAAGAMAFLEGHLKYGRYNWRTAGVSVMVYIDAALRHLIAYMNGEDIDPDSGLPHVSKALACLAIITDAKEVGKLIDDRPTPAPVGDMLNRLKADVTRLQEKYAHA